MTSGRPGLTLIKWGGSLITDKHRPETPQVEIIDRLAAEIAAAGERAGPLLLAHGSGSYGHMAARRTALDPEVEPASVSRRDLLSAVARTQDAAARLHRLVVSSLLRHRVECYSLAPSSFASYVDGELVAEALTPLCSALRLGLAVVTYGDVIMDRQRGAAIASTETILACVVAALQAQEVAIGRCLWLGVTGGILDPDGALVETVGESNIEQVRGWVGGSAGVDVTGGMRLRLEAAWSLAKRDVPSLILDGRVAGRLEAALGGEQVPGTRVAR